MPWILTVRLPAGKPNAALEMRRRGWTADQIDSVIYQNPIRFMGQSPKFKAPAT